MSANDTSLTRSGSPRQSGSGLCRSGVAAIGPRSSRLIPAARHEDGRIAVLDDQRQVGGDAVPSLSVRVTVSGKLRDLAPLMIQLTA